MTKRFNTTGTCFPHLHYMADVSSKFNKAMSLIESGNYFAVNRPRQYGKTTLLEALSRALIQSDEWLVFNISFEGLSSETTADKLSFSRAFIKLLADEMVNRGNADMAAFLNEQSQEVSNLEGVSALITQLVHKSNRKVVLLIDEVDKSSNNQLFLDFLALLRNKYLRRFMITDATFYSVVLAGLYDVKSLRLKLGLNEEATSSNLKYGAAMWHIKKGWFNSVIT